MAAAARMLPAFGNVTIPANERWNPEIERAAGHVDVAREAMEHAADVATAFRVQNLEGIVFRIARVDDHRQAQLARERHLLGEHRPLYVARREVVVVVESDFTHRAHPGISRACRANEPTGHPRVGRLVSLVRMHADRKPRPGTLRGHPLRLRRLARIPRREDAEQARHPGLRHARQHVIQVGSKHRVGQMTMGVDHYR